MTTFRSDPQVRVIDTGGPVVTVTLVYPTHEVSRKVNPSEFEGQRGRDLIAAMRRRAERQ